MCYHTIFFLFFIFAVNTNSTAFYSIPFDSLESVLYSEIPIEQKIKTRNNLAEYYFKYNVNKSIGHLKENLNYSRIEEFPKQKARSLYLMGRAYLLIANFDTLNISSGTELIYNCIDFGIE